jgi:hypothetical protein
LVRAYFEPRGSVDMSEQMLASWVGIFASILAGAAALLTISAVRGGAARQEG